jgi:integrase
MLNDAKVRNAKPDTRPYKLSDSNGLYIEIKPNGGKTWRYRFRIDGKESTFTIGDYTGDENSVSLAQAREARKKARALVKKGINPCLQRQVDKAKQAADHRDTLEALAREWFADPEMIPQTKWTETTRLKQLAMLENAVFPRIGKLPVKEIMSVHILETFKYIKRHHGPATLGHLRRSLKKIFDYAVSNLRAKENPVIPVLDAVSIPSSKNKEDLKPEAIGQLLRDAEGYAARSESLAAFKLQWLTLCRGNEVTGARWAEIDLDNAVWTIPPERMKKRREHKVPLPTQALTLLREVRARTGRYEHVFPGALDRSAPLNVLTLNALVKSIGWSGKFSPHATRATGSTILNEWQFNPDTVEAQLAHIVDPGNRAREAYNNAIHLEARRGMMQTWADYLDTLRDGKNNVIPLRKAL